MAVQIIQAFYILGFIVGSTFTLQSQATGIDTIAPGTPVYVANDYADSIYLKAFAADNFETKLTAAGNLLLQSKLAALRQAASDTIDAVLMRELQANPQLQITDQPGVSKLSDPEGKWNIYTWQNFVNDSTYRYAGIFAGTTGSQPPIRLLDAAQSLGMEGEYELKPDQWYGAVYYGVRPFLQPSGKTAYILFGYDADGFTHRRKVADVLTFNRSGEPRFGAEVFKGREGQPDYTFSRLILEYRVDARVGLNYDEQLGGIVHDRLITGPPVIKGEAPSLIPDGSYDGYIYNKESGKWEWRMEWFDRVISTEAPRPKPILDSSTPQSNTDLFGRPAKVRRSNKPIGIPH